GNASLANIIVWPLLKLMFEFGFVFNAGSVLRQHLLFVDTRLAHDDRRRGCAETRRHALDPLCGWLAEPASVLAAVGAMQFASVWSLADADDADVATARSVAVD